MTSRGVKLLFHQISVWSFLKHISGQRCEKTTTILTIFFQRKKYTVTTQKTVKPSPPQSWMKNAVWGEKEKKIFSNSPQVLDWWWRHEVNCIKYGMLLFWPQVFFLFSHIISLFSQKGGGSLLHDSVHRFAAISPLSLK